MDYKFENNSTQLVETEIMPKSRIAKVKVPKGGRRIIFSGLENHDISLELASKWTKNFRTENPDPNAIKAHFFGKDCITKILEQEECVGIRMYYSIDDTEKKHLILVGVKEDGGDLYNGLIADRSFTCPPYCGGGGDFTNGVELNPLLFG